MPKILQGEMSTSLPKQETTPPGFETDIQNKSSDKDKLKNPEIPPQNTEGSETKEP